MLQFLEVNLNAEALCDVQHLYVKLCLLVLICLSVLGVKVRFLLREVFLQLYNLRSRSRYAYPLLHALDDLLSLQRVLQVCVEDLLAVHSTLRTFS